MGGPGHETITQRPFMLTIVKQKGQRSNEQDGEVGTRGSEQDGGWAEGNMGRMSRISRRQTEKDGQVGGRKTERDGKR